MYSDDKTTLITIAMLKKHGIRNIVASPGTRNADFVCSCQHDKFFKIYSVVDERSAAYFATGLAFELNEPVVITCTGATASRNYLSALTEAYYRHLPIIMLTVGAYTGGGQYLTPQFTDNSVLPKDTNYGQFKIEGTEEQQEFLLNTAIIKATKKSIGPVHIHIHIHTLANVFNVKKLPEVNKCDYYTIPTKEVESELVRKKIGIFIGVHSKMSFELTAAISNFAENFDAVVFSDHTSNYHGKNKILTGQACDIKHLQNLPEIMIDMGGISKIYSACDLFAKADLWRISPDGEPKQRHGILRKFFDCDEAVFFNALKRKSKTGYFARVQDEIGEIKSDGLPLSNTFVCYEIAKNIPNKSVLHLGIQNTNRNMEFFKLDESIDVCANVGGFGIDGPVSTLIGQSMADKNKLYFAIVGDLAFFYDMNILGNRHIANNVRILEINEYIAAAGHFGSAKGWAESMNFEYMSASSKDDFISGLKIFLKKSDKPILFEVFTKPEDEIDAIKMLRKINSGDNPYPFAMYQGCGSMGWNPEDDKPKKKGWFCRK